MTTMMITIKPSARLTPQARLSSDFLTEFGYVAAQVRERGLADDVRLFTEQNLCPIELGNAWLKHGARRPDKEADLRAAEVVDAMKSPHSLGELRRMAGDDPEHFRAMLRLMRSFHLKPVRHEKITPHTLVYKAKPVIA